jgi:hypothetical protein
MLGSFELVSCQQVSCDLEEVKRSDTPYKIQQKRPDSQDPKDAALAGMIDGDVGTSDFESWNFGDY